MSPDNVSVRITHWDSDVTTVYLAFTSKMAALVCLITSVTHRNDLYLPYSLMLSEMITIQKTLVNQAPEQSCNKFLAWPISLYLYCVYSVF